MTALCAVDRQLDVQWEKNVLLSVMLITLKNRTCRNTAVGQTFEILMLLFYVVRKQKAEREQAVSVQFLSPW